VTLSYFSNLENTEQLSEQAQEKSNFN